MHKYNYIDDYVVMCPFFNFSCLCVCVFVFVSYLCPVFVLALASKHVQAH